MGSPRLVLPITTTLLLLLLLNTCSGQRVSSFSRPSTSNGSNKSQMALNLGFLAPHTNFGKREYLRATSSAVSE